MIDTLLLVALCSLSAPEPPSFERDVLPVLTKAGCNSGRCHGSFQGRGGLRLSLLGFAPEADYEAIVKERRGRRISAAAPEQSLLLRKATAAVPHGGGKRFDTESTAYEILRQYIREGAPAPAAAAGTLRLRVEPERLVLGPGASGRLQVRAAWSDGVERNVTEWALFDASQEGLAEISSQGTVTAQNPGKVAVIVRYLGQVATVEVAIPYPSQSTTEGEGAGRKDSARGRQLEDARSPEFARKTFIDELVVTEWKSMAVQPSRPATDSEFLRRVSLDLTGSLPTVEDAKAFIASQDPAKRDRLIDDLLERPSYVDFWTLKWADLLRAHRRFLGDRGLESFTGWIRRAVRDNRPLDEISRELLTGQGNLFTSGPAAFFFIDEQPTDLAEATAQVFLGVRLQCARCHHHPFEVWSQDDYRGLAAFFTNLETKNLDPSGRFGGARILRATDRVTASRRIPGDPVPRVLGGSPLLASAASPAAADLRIPLAEWVTSPENPYFAKNFVNRVWKHLIGRGLVEPVDDLRATNPASLPAVLDALAKDFRDHRYDVKHLIRTICRSSVYQLSAESNPSRDSDGALFTHRIARRMPAEVFLDAISQVTGVAESFPGFPAGTRAIALPDPTVESRFLMTFGRPDRSNACDCARGGQPDLSQILMLINNPSIHGKIADKSGRIAKAIAAERPDREVADEIYLAAFSRYPTQEEHRTIAELLSESKSRREGWEDILWAVLNTAEFTFNH